MQREVQKDIVAEATYVGNRGVWWSAEGLDQYQCNCLTPQILANITDLAINNPADLALLTVSDRLSAGDCRTDLFQPIRECR